MSSPPDAATPTDDIDGAGSSEYDGDVDDRDVGWTMDDALAPSADMQAAYDLLGAGPGGDGAGRANILGPLAKLGLDDLACNVGLTDAIRDGTGTTREDACTVGRQAWRLVEAFDGYAALRDAAASAEGDPASEATRARLLTVATGAATPAEGGECVPCLRLRQRPTIVQTARLFSLSHGQAEVFLLLADALEKEWRGERTEQVRLSNTNYVIVTS
jgi:hypothetical protein